MLMEIHSQRSSKLTFALRVPEYFRNNRNYCLHYATQQKLEIAAIKWKWKWKKNVSFAATHVRHLRIASGEVAAIIYLSIRIHSESGDSCAGNERKQCKQSNMYAIPFSADYQLVAKLSALRSTSKLLFHMLNAIRMPFIQIEMWAKFYLCRAKHRQNYMNGFAYGMRCTRSIFDWEYQCTAPTSNTIRLFTANDFDVFRTLRDSRHTHAGGSFRSLCSRLSPQKLMCVSCRSGSTVLRELHLFESNFIALDRSGTCRFGNT